jgi:tetratricopeptide (TPR) repeat protein
MRRRAAGRTLPLLLALALLVPGCGPADPLEEVRRLHAKGRFEESLAPLLELVAERGDDAEVHYRYGVALTRTGRLSEALWPLRKAMDDPDWLQPAALQLAAGAIETGNHEEAIAATTRLLERDPENTRALLIRAIARMQTRRDYDGALADADRVLELDPLNTQALVPRTIALLGLGRVEEAGEALEMADRAFAEESFGSSETAQYCGARAMFAQEKGELEAAERTYEECLERYPASPILVKAAAGFFAAQGETERATEILRNAHERDPTSRLFRISLALRLQAFGDLEAAERILRAATDVEDPQLAASAWTDLAGFLVQHQRYPAAISAYERAIELVREPTAQLQFVFADALVVAGEHERALALARELTVPAHRALVEGRVHLARGEPERALERFGEGLRLWPDNAVARYYAAIAAERSGDFDRAIEEYRYSIRADASASDARLRLARIHAAEGENELAINVLRHQPPGVGGSLEMTLLEIELLARLGQVEGALPPRLATWVLTPDQWGRALASIAAGTRVRSGPAAAAGRVLGAERLDLADPRNAPALERLVIDLADAGQPAKALAIVDAALEKRPQSAELLTFRALALERLGRPRPEVRDAYARALEVEPELGLALAGLARSAVREDPELALSLYDRAVSADPDDSAAGLAAAQLLVELGRRDDARARLDALLGRHPMDGNAALVLAQLITDSGDAPERALALARRAVRFRAGPAALALLEKLDGATAL